MGMANRRVRRVLLLLAVIAGAAVLYWVVWHPKRDALVVYCSHDSVYAKSILDDFERQTGIPVRVAYDTEATKSLALVDRIIREKDAPQCDVLWNNELLGTVDLKDRGLLQPYMGDGFARIPDAYKDPEGCWAGFGARLRVWIVNTDKLQATQEAIDKALADDLSRVAIAKPLYGTTLTQYAALWKAWGPEGLKAWHRDWRARRVCEVNGNAAVRDLVAGGVCSLGLTDTDDYFGAVDAKKPVAALPVRLPGGKATICIPNTASIIRGTRREADARRLVDYLLSAECELALARSKARQIPLGAVAQDQVPAEVLEMMAWAQDGAPLGGLGPARAECLDWLKSEYAE